MSRSVAASASNAFLTSFTHQPLGHLTDDPHPQLELTSHGTPRAAVAQRLDGVGAPTPRSAVATRA